MYRYLVSLSSKAYSLLFFFCLFLLPITAFGAQANKDSLQGYILLILRFINNTILPLIFSIALLFFLINAGRYFILQGAESEGKEKAKRLALYGIAGFVLMVSIWGIVNMFVFGLGIYDDRAICPEYLDDWCFNNASRNSGGGGAIEIRFSF